MMYFNDVNNLNELKSRFRQWAFKLHPDKGGNEKEFSAMQKRSTGWPCATKTGTALSATMQKHCIGYTLLHPTATPVRNIC